MPKGIGRNYDESFKIKVVLETLKEQKTLSQLSSEFGLHANQISDWKRQAISGLPSLFGAKRDSVSEDIQEELTVPLYQQIGQLKTVRRFGRKRLSKKRCGRICIFICC
jgi:transposase-like protein